MVEIRRAHPLSALSAILTPSFKDRVIAVAAAARDPDVRFSLPQARKIGEPILLRNREDTKIQWTRSVDSLC